MTAYQTVNSIWPDPCPRPTPQEALSGARRLWKLATGKTWSGEWKLTSGRRHTYPRRGVFYVNPARQGWGYSGWKEIVHGLSHAAARRVYPKSRPHDFRHLWLEKRLATHVVNAGWLAGALKREEKPRPSPQERNAARLKAQIERWEKKALSAERAVKRASRTLKKLKRKASHYSPQPS